MSWVRVRRPPAESSALAACMAFCRFLHEELGPRVNCILLAFLRSWELLHSEPEAAAALLRWMSLCACQAMSQVAASYTGLVRNSLREALSNSDTSLAVGQGLSSLSTPRQSPSSTNGRAAKNSASSPRDVAGVKHECPSPR